MHDIGYQCSHQYWVLLCQKVSKCTTENPILVLLTMTMPRTNSHKMDFLEYRCWKGTMHVVCILSNVLINTYEGIGEAGLRSEENWTVLQSQWRTQSTLYGTLELGWTLKIDTHLGKESIYFYFNKSIDIGCSWRGSHNIRTGSSICLKTIFEEEFRYELSICKSTGI